jgi:GNAT superfamily N-acetyltransferase
MAAGRAAAGGMTAGGAALRIEPLDAERWPDLCALFGPAGASSGCWCMFWRLPAKEWSAGTGKAARDPEHGNRVKFERVVATGEPTGLLAYVGDQPVGWCAVAPRLAYPRIFRSRAVAPVEPDDTQVWAVTCFFIHRKHRGLGVGRALLEAAVATAGAAGASSVEGYPVDAGADRLRPGDIYTGTVGLFGHAGFLPVDRPAAGNRITMRRVLSGIRPQPSGPAVS